MCKDFGLGFGELKGSRTLSFEKLDDKDTILDESGQRRHRQLLGKLLWLDRPDIKKAICQLSTHVGTATTRDGINIKRPLRHLVGDLACNMIVGRQRSSKKLWNRSLGQGFCGRHVVLRVCVFQETEHFLAG